ncbi:hypothetical protein [uncultured Pseudacidovorax sp.]|uniref:hypothetical protein n=1 Tax=uncultured Pseudacidovorax sp. TaxID=679313 RepID=UPI0025F2D38C|nr:hypothetical protein [uncultured Pseudacidovorax sp.]
MSQALCVADGGAPGLAEEGEVMGGAGAPRRGAFGGGVSSAEAYRESPARAWRLRGSGTRLARWHRACGLAPFTPSLAPDRFYPEPVALSRSP